MTWVSFQTRIDNQDVREIFDGHFYAWILGEVEGVACDHGRSGKYTTCNEIQADAEGGSPDMAMQQAMNNFKFKVQEAKHHIEQCFMDQLG